MKVRDLADRIGNIDPALVAEAGGPRKNRRRMPARELCRRFFAAAVIALMICSGTVGALAFSRETLVEVPVEREKVVLEDIGLTVIFPDAWEGRYAVWEANGQYVIYSPSVKDAWLALSGGAFEDPELEAFNGGVLCYIMRYDEPMTETQFVENGYDFTAYQYLFATRDYTYIFYYASDVQFTEETREEYEQMEQGIKDIRFIVQ